MVSFFKNLSKYVFHWYCWTWYALFSIGFLCMHTIFCNTLKCQCSKTSFPLNSFSSKIVLTVLILEAPNLIHSAKSKQQKKYFAEGIKVFLTYRKRRYLNKPIHLNYMALLSVQLWHNVSLWRFLVLLAIYRNIGN